MSKIIPLTLKQANDFIEQHHRHHKKVQGHRFSLGLYDFEMDKLIGVCCVGRPVSRELDPYFTAKVTRLCTDGAKNACSKLYSAAARACYEMGFSNIQTYILDTENGASLKASGWSFVAKTNGGDWNNSKQNKGTRRTDQPMNAKQRWEKKLTVNKQKEKNTCS